MGLTLDSASRSIVEFTVSKPSPCLSAEMSTRLCRGFNSMTDAELCAEVDAHGNSEDFGISRQNNPKKRRASRIGFLEMCGRAKYARREDEELTCSLNDQLWGRIVQELLEQDLFAAMRLRRVNRQLARVVNKSGLWARVLEKLVADMEISEDGVSVALISQVLPRLCFESLLHGSANLGPQNYEGLAVFHSRGFLSVIHDRVMFLFSTVGKRFLETLMKTARVEFQKPGLLSLQVVSARLLLKRVFERGSKRGSSLREIFEQVLRNKELLWSRWVELEKILQGGGNEVLTGCSAHELYALGRYDLACAVRIIEDKRKKVELCLVMKHMESDLLGHGCKLSALSSGTAAFIQNRSASGSIEDVMRNMLRMAFYYRLTPYIYLRETLDPSGDDLEVQAIAEKALEELLKAGRSGKAILRTGSSFLVADELVDRTEACKLLRRVALFWIVLIRDSTDRHFQEDELRQMCIADEYTDTCEGLKAAMEDMGLRKDDLRSFFSWPLERYVALYGRVLAFSLTRETSRSGQEIAAPT